MKRISMFAILVIFCVTILSIVCINPITSEAADKVFKWRAVAHTMAGTEDFALVEAFCDAIKKASNGRLVIEPFGAGVLFPVYDSFDSVKTGTVEMMLCSHGYWGGKDPSFLYATRPGCPIQYFHEVMYLEDTIKPWVDKLYAKHGLVHLDTPDTCTVEPLMLSKKPVRSLGDFKGMNVRSSGLGASFYEKLGASVVSVSGPEIYSALQLGTVDAAEYTTWQENMSMGFHEVSKYALYPTGHLGATTAQVVVVNSKKWEDLPEDLRTIVELAIADFRVKAAVKVHVGDAIYRKKWEDAGVEIVSLPDEDFQEMLKIGLQVTKEYHQGNPNGQEFLKLYSKVLFDLGYVEQAKILGFEINQ